MLMAIAWILFLVFILIGIPIAFALGGSSVMLLLIGSTNTNIVIVQKMCTGVDSFTLLAIPFFMLAGAMMSATSIGDRIFDFARTCVGHLYGGLAQVNILSSMITAGMSGTCINDISSIGPIEVRAMEKSGFDRPFAAAVTGASAAIGPIIPPSVPLVLIGSIMGCSVSKLLLGGLFPGILMGVAEMIYCYIVSKKRNYSREAKTPFKGCVVAFFKALPPIMMPVILIAGFLTGIVTPTEAACVAVLYAMLLCFVVYRELSLKQFWNLLKDTATLCSTTMLVIATANAFGIVITQQQIPQKMAAAIATVSSNYYIVALFIIVLLAFLGCLLDTTAIMVIMTPILSVIAFSIGMDAITFGVLEALVVTIGMFTPPVGVGMFLLCRVAQVKTGTFLKEMWPFIIILFVCAYLLVIFPPIVTWLPNIAL